jgi:hypothetical protein
VDLDDRVEDAVDDRQREPHRRLVEQQQFGIGEQGAPEREHLLLTAAERPGQLIPALMQAGEQAVDAIEVPDRFDVASSTTVGAQPEVLDDAERRRHVAALRHDGETGSDQATRAQRADLFAFELDRPARRPHEPGDRVDEGRLAGAVGADEGDELSGPDVKADLLHRLHRAVP